MLTKNSYMEKLNSLYLYSTCKLINKHGLYFYFYFILFYKGLILTLASNHNPPAILSQLLEFLACVTTPSYSVIFKSKLPRFFKNYNLLHILH